MSRHSASKKEKKSRLVLNTFLVLLGVTAICSAVIIAVIFIPSSEKSLKAPVAPTATAQASAGSEEKNIDETAPSPEPDPTPEPTTEERKSAPVFSRVTASSTREPYKTSTGTITYPVTNAFDNNENTVWTPDPGEDSPWVEMTASSDQTVKGIEIVNGYAKSKKLYEANGRAKDVVVECNGVKYSYTLQDKGAGKTQRLAFPDAVETKKITITVNSCYDGKEYDDLCISEITPY